MKKNQSNLNEFKNSPFAKAHNMNFAQSRVFLLMAGISLSPLFAFGADEKTGLGSGRLVPVAAGVMALIGLWLGRKAVKGAAHGLGLQNAQIALTLGILSTAIATIHALNAQGGVGTGNGLAGAVIAIFVGVLAVLQAIFAWMKIKK